MFNPARKVAKGIISKPFKPAESLTVPSQCLPERYALSEIYGELESKDKDINSEDTLENVLILASCLVYSDRVVRETNDDEAINKLSLWVSKAILPQGNLVPQDEMPEDNNPSSRGEALNLTRRMSILGLQSLNLLITQISSPSPQALDTKILLSLLAYTNPRDPWTTPTASDLAHAILSKYGHQTITSDFIVSFLLQTFIRPLFSKSKPASITSTGRKAMPSSAPPKKFEAADLDRRSKPWKYEVVYSVTVLRWVLENAPSPLISSSWHLFVPPLLTTLDDQSIRVRVAGCQMFTHFLPNLTPKLLSQSGLDQVFEDALMPALLYLPNLTPLEESLQLLPAAYQALGVLCDVRFPSPSSEALPQGGKSTEQPEQLQRERIKLLDRILRNGVFPGYAHSHEHAAIVQVLVQQLRGLVSKLGLHSVKHLKDIFPILLTSVSDPFIPSARPSLLLDCILALQTTILCAWPRVGAERHRIEILKGITVCWKNITDAHVDERDEERREQLEEAKVELKVVGRLFVRATDTGAAGHGEDERGDVEMLASKFQGMGMGELFGV